ncbi:MAG: bifunctional 4-hydroxy-2-oxoglutarate aldolase/2-dehydro-3-deoxy-phosphogluconate aldolase, partial [Candidatus Omnitrophica bacterium]|nr:bifunctional 4-hydroxy-2-oxoglutarate aldolase/2-dehydro-3-deoxy-phosphogluconate aldolase [Candidatus Omnitrophota bacterium]
MNIENFCKLPILGILRGITLAESAPILEACQSAGLKTLEITMNTPNAPEIIKYFSKHAGKDISVGAGTVITEDGLNKAIDAGAEFIVMPAFLGNIMKICKTKNIPVFPGALTPTEVLQAWQSGAAMVKVFPAGVFGPKYFTELKGPLNDVKLMAVGGVNEKNIKDYFKAGADAVAFGASVFKREWLDAGNFDA